MIKQPYILIFFALLLALSTAMIILGYSRWWYVGLVIGFYGTVIAFLHWISPPED
jgi:hypothetical protein